MKTEIVGSGRPIVLVPGGLTGWISWKPHAARLAENHLVIRVQLLAVEYGLLGRNLPNGYGVDTEVAALASALANSGIGRADFVAWSYGAEIALSYAIANPQRVRSLTLIEPPAVWVMRSRGALSAEVLDQQERLRGMSGEDISESQLEWFTHFAGFVPPNVDPRKLPQWPSWVEHRRSLLTGDASFRHEDDMGRVRAFRQPVLLFKGEGSSDFLRRIVDILGEEFPGAAIESLPGAHALHLVSMEEFLRMLLAFQQRA